MVNSSPQTCIIYFFVAKRTSLGQGSWKVYPQLTLQSRMSTIGLFSWFGFVWKIWNSQNLMFFCACCPILRGHNYPRYMHRYLIFRRAFICFPLFDLRWSVQGWICSNHLEKNSWSASCRSRRSCLQQTHFGEVDAGREGLRRLRFTCNVDHVGGLRVGARFSELKPKNGAENYN